MTTGTEAKTVITSTNPANRQVLAEIAVTKLDDIEQMVAAAHDAQRLWRTVRISQRLAYVERFRQVLYNRREEVAQWITSETGKPLVESLAAEVFAVMETCNWLRGNSRRLLAPEPVVLNPLFFMGKRSYNVLEPYGVIAVISPWNYPFSIPLSSMLSALVCGNAVIWKPSPKAAFVAQQTMQLFREAGLPVDLVTLVQGDKDEAEKLVLSNVQRVMFTGSTGGGKAIMQLAARKVMPVTLELGGKHPAIVLDDSDVDSIARPLVWAAFTNAGQACASIERVFVTPALKEKLVAKIVEQTRLLRLGDGMSENTDVGPLIDEQQALRVERQVQDAVAKGAKLLVGGRPRFDLGGYFFEPTILSEVSTGMSVFDDEIFGPVLPIVEVRSEQEAISLANRSSLGLGASIWSANTDRAERLARQLDTGMVWINDGLYTHVAPDAPWGGVKESGFGRMHSASELRDLVYQKNIGVNKQEEGKVLFPYSNAVLDYVRGGIGLVHGTATSKLNAVKNVVSALKSLGHK
jgi:succinate-semialdehyde dehydrogenase/glutarate-semialdehyde dehydrogenase